MAIATKIFSLYKLPDREQYFLLRTVRPEYSNASQIEENLAERIEAEFRVYMLRCIAKLFSHGDHPEFEYIGELQGSPIGEVLYNSHGGMQLSIWYIHTEFGKPWIIVGNAATEADFLTQLREDDDLMSLRPVGSPDHIQATFFTENDFVPGTESRP